MERDLQCGVILGLCNTNANCLLRITACMIVVFVFVSYLFCSIMVGLNWVMFLLKYRMLCFLMIVK